MGFTLAAERFRRRVESAKGAQEIRAFNPKRAAHPCAERASVRSFHRTVAAIAAAVIGGADRSASCVRDRSEAWRPVSDHHANRAAQFALEAHAVRWSVWLRSEERRVGKECMSR